MSDQRPGREALQKPEVDIAYTGPARAYTKEEVRAQFLDQTRMLVKYWSTVLIETLSTRDDLQRRCEGVAFSILTLIDGSTDFPALDLALAPHPNDKAFHQGEGSNWYEPGMVINDDVSLHDLFFKG